MYFRIKKTPSGQTLQLIEAYRNSQGKARQRVVVSLGNAHIEKDDLKPIAKLCEAKLHNTADLFEDQYPDSITKWVDRIVRRVDSEGRWRLAPTEEKQKNSVDAQEIIDGVLAEKVAHSNSTILGPSLLAYHAFCDLGLDKLLLSLGFNQMQCDAATTSIINRLVEPCSEHALRDWLSSSSLSVMLESELISGGKDRFYRISDKLFKYKKHISRHLQQREQELFHPDRTILLYDLTNSYFEGTARENPKARRGRSKEKRNDCPLIVLGMIFDSEGFELAHEVFEGNTADSKSLVTMIKKLREHMITTEQEKVELIIMDAGIATKGNLEYLRKEKLGYLVNDTRSGRKRYYEQFAIDEGFETIPDRKDGNQVQLKRLREGDDTLLLCRSQGRQEKEQAIYSRAEEKLLQELNKLKRRIETGGIKNPAKINQRIGTLRTRHSRAGRFYNIELHEFKKRSSLCWSRKDEEYDRQKELFGCYVLRSSKQDITAEKLWHLYMTLTRAEDGFRALKSNLGLRPNFHRIEGRVDAHVFITTLAYHLLQYIMYTLRQNGDNRSWQTIRRILQTHCYTTIILPTRYGTIYRINKPGLPEERHKQIYRVFDINCQNLPQSRMVIK